MTLKMFKQTKRFSVLDRPTKDSKVFFSHCKVLTTSGVIKEIDRKFTNRKYLKKNSICKVICNTQNLVLVKFPKANDTDLVSPEFLINLELTQKGQEILGDKWTKMINSA